MGDKSNIEWTDASWNVITGCSVVSPGCKNCYAMRQAGTRLARTPSYEGLTVDSKAGPVWNGEVRFNEKQLTLPLQWTRPRRIFVNSMGDLFHESVPDEWIDKVFAVMALADRHVFQILTKRPARMRDYFKGIKDYPNEPAFRDAIIEGEAQALYSKLHPNELDVSQWLAVHMPLDNVWLGTSCEDQQRADERIPPLLDTPAAVRWVSAEPLLGPIDFEAVLVGRACNTLDWVVVGCESGPGARRMEENWARSISDQCKAAGVPFFMKQMAHKNRPWKVEKELNRFPVDLQIREYPQ